MAKQWVTVHPSTVMQAGHFYRATWIVAAPFPNETMQGMIRRAVNLADKVAVKYTVKEVNFYSPKESVYISRYPAWGFEVIFQDQDQAQIALVAGAIAAAFGVVFLGWSLLNGSLQHLVETGGEEANKLADKLTSPGLVIAGLILGVLTLVKR